MQKCAVDLHTDGVWAIRRTVMDFITIIPVGSTQIEKSVKIAHRMTKKSKSYVAFFS